MSKITIRPESLKAFEECLRDTSFSIDYKIDEPTGTITFDGHGLYEDEEISEEVQNFAYQNKLKIMSIATGLNENLLGKKIKIEQDVNFSTLDRGDSKGPVEGEVYKVEKDKIFLKNIFGHTYIIDKKYLKLSNKMINESVITIDIKSQLEKDLRELLEKSFKNFTLEELSVADTFFNLTISTENDDIKDDLESNRLLISKIMMEFKNELMEKLVDKNYSIVNISVKKYAFVKGTNIIKFVLGILVNNTDNKDYVSGRWKKDLKESVEKVSKEFTVSEDADLTEIKNKLEAKDRSIKANQVTIDSIRVRWPKDKYTEKDIQKMINESKQIIKEASNESLQNLKLELEKKLGRKIKLNYVNRGMGDVYYQFSVNANEKKKIYNFFTKSPNNKKEGAKGTYNKEIGFLDFIDTKISIINPAKDGDNKIAFSVIKKNIKESKQIIKEASVYSLKPGDLYLYNGGADIQTLEFVSFEGEKYKFKKITDGKFWTLSKQEVGRYIESSKKLKTDSLKSVKESKQLKESTVEGRESYAGINFLIKHRVGEGYFACCDSETGKLINKIYFDKYDQALEHGEKEIEGYLESDEEESNDQSNEKNFNGVRKREYEEDWSLNEKINLKEVARVLTELEKEVLKEDLTKAQESKINKKILEYKETSDYIIKRQEELDKILKKQVQKQLNLHNQIFELMREFKLDKYATDNIIASIKEGFDRKSVKYQQAFEQLIEKLNIRLSEHSKLIEKEVNVALRKNTNMTHVQPNLTIKGVKESKKINTLIKLIEEQSGKKVSFMNEGLVDWVKSLYFSLKKYVIGFKSIKNQLEKLQQLS